MRKRVSVWLLAFSAVLVMAWLFQRLPLRLTSGTFMTAAKCRVG